MIGVGVYICSIVRPNHREDELVFLARSPAWNLAGNTLMSRQSKKPLNIYIPGKTATTLLLQIYYAYCICTVLPPNIDCLTKMSWMAICIGAFRTMPTPK